jgi:signal transduction histidine kinase
MPLKKPIRILMLEDLDEDVGLVRRVLRKEGFEFDLLKVDERREYEDALQTYRPDVILSDHALPQFNSIEALDIRLHHAPDTPFILVTGAVSEEFAAQCIKRGADDYILKSNLTRLPVAIVNALETRTREDQRKEDEFSIREKNRELTKINQELDSFIYSVSHNLRAPLASVLGLVNLAKLENSVDPSSAARYLAMIEQSINRLDDTIKEILEYSRNARTSIKPVEIDLEKIFHDSLERLQYFRGFDAIRKSVVIHSMVPFYSDHHRLSVVIANLVTNAVKYADPAKPESFIQFTAELNYPFTTISLVDNGVGIRADHLPHLYAMFYRATELSDGAGLGLYIVKEILQKLHGVIEVSSVEHEGTTFTLKIPNLNPEYYR